MRFTGYYGSISLSMGDAFTGCSTCISASCFTKKGFSRKVLKEGLFEKQLHKTFGMWKFFLKRGGGNFA